jgi:hypothetical protein
MKLILIHIILFLIILISFLIITYLLIINNNIIDNFEDAVSPLRENVDYEIKDVLNSATEKYIIFRKSGRLDISRDLSNSTILIVGGGGGGGFNGGGGGGGGVFYSIVDIKAGSYDINIGKGGSGGDFNNRNGYKGEDSSFKTPINQTENKVDYTAIGGGGGVGSYTDYDKLYSDGGSGGGGSLIKIDGYKNGKYNIRKGGISSYNNSNNNNYFGKNGANGSIYIFYEHLGRFREEYDNTYKDKFKVILGGGGGGASAKGIKGRYIYYREKRKYAFVGGNGGNGVKINITGEDNIYYSGGGSGGIYYKDMVESNNARYCIHLNERCIQNTICKKIGKINKCTVTYTPCCDNVLYFEGCMGGIGGGGSIINDKIDADNYTGGGGSGSIGNTDMKNNKGGSGGCGIIILRYTPPPPIEIQQTATIQTSSSDQSGNQQPASSDQSGNQQTSAQTQQTEIITFTPSPISVPTAPSTAVTPPDPIPTSNNVPEVNNNTSVLLPEPYRMGILPLAGMLDDSEAIANDYQNDWLL